jgi:hypothetical protein
VLRQVADPPRPLARVQRGERLSAEQHRAAVRRQQPRQRLAQRELYQPVWKGSPGRRRDERSTSFVVSSERLTDDVLWKVVEPNHMISICRDGSVHFFAMGPDGLVAAARGTTDGHPYSRSGSQR